MSVWRRISNIFTARRNGSCCGDGRQIAETGLKKVIIVGSPNVGKSVVFNSLTGAHATVSNYPGTTVTVSRGKARIDGLELEVADTPGMYSLLPITEEERVARSILLSEKPQVILQVVDAKNVERMLPLTLQLIEAGFPVMLDLNMMDETEAAGIEVNVSRLEAELGIPVVATVATTGRGMEALRKRLVTHVTPSRCTAKYDGVEPALSEIEGRLTGNYGVSKRAVGLLLLQGDPDMESQVRDKESAYTTIQNVMARARASYSQPLSYVIALKRQQEVKRIISLAVTLTGKRSRGLAERLSRAMMNPVTGIPILLIFLYFGLYQFVGVLGAGTLVNFFEKTLFGQWINPWVANLVTSAIPFRLVQDLLVGQYGVITLGFTYAFALILPIVTTFFIVFSVIEDSGYLPRLAMLIDTVFKRIGLSGRAVIPMVLGFGCDTMATMVTRTQETNRERVISTLLLALAIPCSAQLGVVFAILSSNILGLAIWGGVVALVFLLVGYLAAKVLSGERPSFYMEVPPLRLPQLSNVLAKTYSRLQWYFFEVLPLFVLTSVLLWAGDETGGLSFIAHRLEPVVKFIGLPQETAVVFLYGFFRRDFGAAGLYNLNRLGILVGVPLVVAAVTLTLFVPCVAQFSMMVKERGFKTALAIAGFIFPFAFLVGFALNLVLTGLGVSL